MPFGWFITVCFVLWHLPISTRLQAEHKLIAIILIGLILFFNSIKSCYVEFSSKSNMQAAIAPKSSKYPSINQNYHLKP